MQRNTSILSILDSCYTVARRPNVWNTLAYGGVIYPDFDPEGSVDRHSKALKHAVRTGRVIDLGSMSYEASKEASEVGMSLWQRVGFRWPFHSPFVVICDNAYKRDKKPETVVVVAEPDPDNENLIRLSECSVTKQKDLVCWTITEWIVGEKFRTVCELAPMPEAMIKETPLEFAIVPYNTVFAAIAVCNTKGIAHRSYPKTKAAPVARTEFQTGPYFSALTGRRDDKAPTGTHRSPIPHIRRGHMRHFKDGRKTWIRDALIGARSEDELSFAERRIAYKSEGGSHGTDLSTRRHS